MTVEEFKKLKPEHAGLEGDHLYDVMAEYMIGQQQSGEILKQIMPLWKTHTLRWLFYRQIPNFVIGNPKTDKWVSDERCSKCKWGVNARMIYSVRLADYSWKSISNCPHCNQDYIPEPNTNLTHRLYKFLTKIKNLFWYFLDKSHIVRSSINDRYGMGGDESRYVKSTLPYKSGKVEYKFHKRKWWEYIIIEKPFHKF